MKPTVLSHDRRRHARSAHAARPSKSIASDAATDVQYCRTLARTYQSLHPVQQGVRASDRRLSLC